MPWGEKELVKNNFNQLKLYCKNASGKKLNIVFRVYDDGLGFRYEFPEQDFESIEIIDEHTEFNLTEIISVGGFPEIGIFMNTFFELQESPKLMQQNIEIILL